MFSKKNLGFTLIELSIVLVIIGLIVGSVLVGQTLIKAAQGRGQISQIEEVMTATYAFQNKYGQLPGDLSSTEATSFGFYRTTSPNLTGCDGYMATGCGNNNGIIGNNNATVSSGEAHLFWLDLGLANLSKFKPQTDGYTQNTNVALFLPAGKIDGTFLYQWSGGVAGNDGRNYLSVMGVRGYCQDGQGHPTNCGTTNIIPVVDAYNIDVKTDDGLPQSGKILAVMIGYSGLMPNCVGSATQALWIGASTNNCWGSPTTAAVTGGSTTCYDNNNTAGRVQQYSLGQSGGDNKTCALSFQY